MLLLKISPKAKMKNHLIKDGLKYLEHPQPSHDFSLTDIFILLFVLLFSFFSHTFRIHYPPSRVFDETHFGSFTNAYIRHRYYHDIHPPLAKLLFYLAGYLSGYDGKIDFRDKNVTSYFDKQYVSLRQASSSFSSLIGPVGFLSMRFFGFSTSASFMVAMFLSTESMIIVEGRLILTDGFLHSFATLTILSVSLYCFKPTSKLCILFMGLMAGSTFSIKYTGLSVLVFVGVNQLLHFSKSQLKVLFDFDLSFYDRSKLTRSEEIFELFSSFCKMPFYKLFLQFLIVLAIGISLLYSIFVIHIIILDYRSEYDVFMPQAFRNTLIPENSTDFSPRTKHMSMFKRVTTLIQVMHKSNMRITKPHSAASKWYQWPLVQMKSLVYHSHKYSLILFPTPIIWYPAAISPIICIILAIFGYFYEHYDLTRLIIWSVGYYASLVPFALIPRVIFVYHYLISLIFGIFATGALIDVVFSSNKRIRACIFTLLVIAVVIQYIFFFPWCYAMAHVDWNVRKWYKNIFGK
ncbi:Dolichyl-phosphate-mannose-protein mannosyltransferase [Tritrichomonas foetus]|uniref:Dolichyl-phosphate-mannose-protein mannosyltransferase n=1 Tax=Tritrichomonas foetus TaxID=1144522 RepID=A0A1J4KSG9_9EUKA|nr:Dolichyl-phosphate-mannose-protein mannosyltransferase [Tritrichomonas foetus]|eukprot:OHT14050.1 Dolichyl-phosphate-mannose-protein mannosyltransferase [Tritrichomonas foetus]